MGSFERRGRRVGLVLAAALVVACGGNGGHGTSGTGAGGSGAGGAGGSVANGCGPSNVDACEYPSAGLSFDVREGIDVTDPVTGRVLPLLVRVPKGPGPFPAIVWSHGGAFNATGHRLLKTWGETMAAHGYAGIHIAHVPLTAETGAAMCTVGSVPAAECVPPSDEDATGYIALVKSRDVVAVLDALPMLSDASVKAGGPAIDLDRIAVAGWSGGARAPIVTYGAVFYPSPSAPKMSMSHPLPKASVALSPMAPGYAGFFDEGTDDTWQHMRGPVFMGTGDNDLKPAKPDLTGADRRIAFEKQPADGSRWLLYSKLAPGVGAHGTYNLDDVGSNDERLSRLSRALQSGVRAFLDAKLKGDAKAEQWLASTNAAVLAGEAEWVHK